MAAPAIMPQIEWLLRTGARKSNKLYYDLGNTQMVEGAVTIVRNNLLPYGGTAG